MSDTSIRTFGQLVQSLEDGQLVADLGDKLQDLNGKIARSAESIGKAKGELTLKIKLNAEIGGTVQIDSEITVKEPKMPRARSVMWLNKDNNLSAENPKQTKLPLREVPPAAAAAGAPRSV